MSSSKLTLMGMYHYDDDLFTNLSLPTGIDSSILIDNILNRSAEFEVMYGDIDYNKYMIGAWSRKWMPTMQRWVDALAIEYAPLENYDRKEDWTDTRNGHTSGETSGRTNSTNTNKVSAYDAGDALTTKDANTLVGADSSSSSGESHEGAKHDGRIHGNIGVTTSQQMLLAELDLGYWNIYEKITDLFLTEFTIPVY